MTYEDNMVEKVLSECHKLESVLNDKLLPQFLKLHRADPKYCHLKLKQEVLAKKAIFFTKKKYGLYIKNKEGKSVSEFDIKGMILRRSNFPVFSKEKILILMDMILKSEQIDIPKIRSFISETEKEIIELCENNSKLISGAVSYSKPISQYKAVPYQIKAMELWNQIEYKYFIPGTKGYLFRIKGVDFMNAPDHVNKNLSETSMHKHVVIPYEEEKLPSYYILDRTAQIKFAWADRVKEVLDVLLPNKIMTMDDIFE